MRRARLTVHVSTKLNRSHAVTGARALILPTLGRTERDVQAGGEQFVTVEDSMGMVHASRGRLEPRVPHLLSEVAIVVPAGPRASSATPARAVGGVRGGLRPIRDRIARVVPGFEDFNARVARARRLRPAARAARRAPLPDRDRQGQLHRRAGRVPDVPAGPAAAPDPAQPRPVQHHDLRPRRPLPRHQRRPPRRLRQPRGRSPSSASPTATYVDLVSEWTDGIERRAPGFRVVHYPTARGCAAAYYPETNVLVPLDSTADTSNTPASKSVVVRLERRPDRATCSAGMTAVPITDERSRTPWASSTHVKFPQEVLDEYAALGIDLPALFSAGHLGDADGRPDPRGVGRTGRRHHAGRGQHPAVRTAARRRLRRARRDPRLGRRRCCTAASPRSPSASTSTAPTTAACAPALVTGVATPVHRGRSTATYEIVITDEQTDASAPPASPASCATSHRPTRPTCARRADAGGVQTRTPLGAPPQTPDLCPPTTRLGRSRGGPAPGGFAPSGWARARDGLNSPPDSVGREVRGPTRRSKRGAWTAERWAEGQPQAARSRGRVRRQGDVSGGVRPQRLARQRRYLRGRPIPRRSEDGHPPTRPRPTTQPAQASPQPDTLPSMTGTGTVEPGNSPAADGSYDVLGVDAPRLTDHLSARWNTPPTHPQSRPRHSRSPPRNPPPRTGIHRSYRDNSHNHHQNQRFRLFGPAPECRSSLS